VVRGSLWPAARRTSSSVAPFSSARRGRGVHFNRLAFGFRLTSHTGGEFGAQHDTADMPIRLRNQRKHQQARK
jgi:hypothetical protein